MFTYMYIYIYTHSIQISKPLLNCYTSVCFLDHQRTVYIFNVLSAISLLLVTLMLCLQLASQKISLQNSFFTVVGQCCHQHMLR